MHKRKVIPEIEKLVRSTLNIEHWTLNIGSNIWYTIPGKILIGDAVFKFSDYR
jgi:hypothetical protein